MANGNGVGDKLAERSDARLWQIVIASLLAGGLGGFGFRQIDPSAFTAKEGEDLKRDIRILEQNDRIQDIKLGQLPPTKLLLQINRHEYRLEALERDHKRHEMQKKNLTPSQGR